jgi:hypothetical protein
MVAGLWGQLEYSVAQAAPWLQLRKGPRRASENLLLNYVSPWSICSVFPSLFAGHFPVTIVAFGSILLKVTIIVSTGLFSLENRQLSYTTSLKLLDQFNMSSSKSANESPLDAGFVFWAIGNDGASFPAGVTPEFATLSVALDNHTGPNGGSGTAISATVPLPVFHAHLENCQTFSWSYNLTQKGYLFPLSDIVPSTDFERLAPLCVYYPYFIFEDAPAPSLASNISAAYLGEIMMVFEHPDCGVLLDDPESSVFNIPFVERPQIFASILREGADNISSVTAILCDSLLSVTRRHVTTSGDRVIAVSSQILDIQDLGQSPSVLTAIFADEWRNMARVPLTGLAPWNGSYWITPLNYTTPRPEWEDFSDPDVLEQALCKTWVTATAVLAKLWKTVPAGQTERVDGVVNYTANRLVVIPVILRVVVVFLALLTGGLLLLCGFDFWPVIDSPPSLLTSAKVLSRSEKLEQTLSNASVATSQRIGECLHPFLFSTQSDAGQLRVVLESTWQHDLLPAWRGSRKTSQWWVPVAATNAFRIAILSTTLLLVGLLELLFQSSSRNNGLADLSASTWAEYSYNFGPVLVMFGLGLCYVAMDRAVRELHTFLQLSSAKGRSGLDVLQFDPNASVAPVALVRAIRRSYYGLAALVMSSILATVLTVSASGLFVAQVVPKSVSISTAPAGWFDLRSASEPTNGSDTIRNQEIQFYNMSEPVGTYGEFAFAEVDPTTWRRPEISGRNGTKFRAQIPAVRAQSNCSLYSYQPLVRNMSDEFWDINIAPPAGCTPGGDPLSDGKSIRISTSSNSGIQPHDGAFAFVSTTEWSRSPLAFDPDGLTYTPVERGPYTVCDDSVQHVWIYYGRFDPALNDTYDLTFLHCIPFVEALEIEATFNLPSFTVDDTAPPKPVTSPTPWASLNRSQNSIPFPKTETYVGDGYNFDDFFSIVTRGLKGVPAEELIGMDKLDTMIGKINAVYQELGAVFLHYTCRTKVTDGSIQGRPVPGLVRGQVLMTHGSDVQTRLYQREVPTRLLQALLVCLTILAILGFWLVGPMNVLPDDPGSVAAQMSLFAGSKLVQRLRSDGTERSLESEEFRLDWWDRKISEKAANEIKGRYGIDIAGG